MSVVVSDERRQVVRGRVAIVRQSGDGSSVPESQPERDEPREPESRVIVARQAPRVGFVGKSGVGKTTLKKECVYEWLDAHPTNVRFLAWDHTIEWGESHPNLHVYPSNLWTLEQVCEIALELGDCTVCADEIDLECSSMGGLIRGTAIHAIVNYGRHHNVGLLWAARRAADVPRGLTANTNHLFLLRTDEPRDLKWIADKTNQESADKAASLEPGDWFYVRC